MISLKPETIEKIDKLVPRYPTVRSAALPLCHLVQEDLGYLSNESIEWIAERLELGLVARLVVESGKSSTLGRSEASS